MYQVFDNGRPADKTGFPLLIGKGWDTSSFPALQEAQEYALNWLNLPQNCGLELQVDAPYDYSGYGDILEIKVL